MSLQKAVDEAYKQRSSLIILGLTGRTGSGCSTVASILRKSKIQDLDLLDSKSYDFKDVEERKDSIIKNFMIENDRWKPFITIEASSVIFSFVLEKGYKSLENYLQKMKVGNNVVSFNIGDYDEVLKKLKGIEYMYQEMQKFRFDNIDRLLLDNEEVKKYFDFYTKTIIEFKGRFKKLLLDYSGYEIEKRRFKEKKINKHHLFTYLMQRFGNNIRSSGDPFNECFVEEMYNVFIERIDNIIKIIYRYNEINGEKSTRICIDAIRNPFEAHYLRDRYRAFYLLSINTEEKDRKERLGLSREELINLDKIEYPSHMGKAQEIFYHQDIQTCLEIADIHIYNPNVKNKKYYLLTKQLLRYIALILQPGLVTPTNIERCMQLAYNMKFSSGCLSRQVGAIVTDEDFSVKSVGWNDVPKGQISCNLRDVRAFCSNRDSETYSEYECCSEEFGTIMDKINKKLESVNLLGRPYAYCFKDIYNSMKNDKNQVYTRALHAEENAFLQICKYGGQSIKNGKLFTTASPCELCAKKAYQLGIKEIYYIDPYPGISRTHILSFGKKDNPNNPKMFLFYGAIGNAYISLYAPRMSFKDELELCTGIKIKNIFNQKELDKKLKWNDIINKNFELEMKFDSREKIECTRKVEFEVNCDFLDKIEKSFIWTGSSYDGTTLIDNDGGYSFEEEPNGENQYYYSIKFDKQKKKGELVKYTVQSKLKDEKKVMEPYLSHIVNNKTEKLTIRLVCSPGIVKNVQIVIYADTFKECVFEAKGIENKGDDVHEVYEFYIENPNLFYSYSLEWEFVS